jgi:4-amino-4-deoxy-L-arabinose transferase-like glycosyltransferase
MKILKELKLPYLIIIISGFVSAFSLPFIPIDETRYLTVAWEMKLYNSFIVPVLNGLTYAHKPPLLFWLINLDWSIFGVNEKTLRFIPILFSLLNITLVYKLALLLWKDKRIAGYAAIILSSTFVYLVTSSLVMFDIMLTFWVLTGITGLLFLAEGRRKVSMLLIALSIGGGILTKGPVIFIHILPAAFFYFLWKSENDIKTGNWYFRFILSMFLGIMIALLWVIPAAITGGEAYRDAILWGQTANRIVASFAHQRPVWWYVPLIPVVLFPWILLKPLWLGLSTVKKNRYFKLLIIWIVSTFILFSLISGKQIHYLIPMLPAVSLLSAKILADYAKRHGDTFRWHYLPATFYIITGILLLFLPVLNLKGDIGQIPGDALLIPAIGLIIMGAGMMFFRRLSLQNSIKITAFSTLFFIIILMIGANPIFNRYDLHKIAGILKTKQDAGYSIVHYGEYDGQYQFLGRLKRPLTVLEDKESLHDFIQSHNNVLVLTYINRNKTTDPDSIIYQQSYMGKKVVLYKAKSKYVQGNEGLPE